MQSEDERELNCFYMQDPARCLTGRMSHPSVHLPKDLRKIKMKITTTSQTPRVTQAPYFRPELLRKRGETTCGDLRDAYSGIQAPICSGVTSICTFTDSLQACCDSSGSCQFYTTCNGWRSPITCSDSRCLKCASASPYCIKYNFYDANSGDYNGYSCGNVDLQGTTIQGVALALAAGYVTNSLTTTTQPSADITSASSQSTSIGSSSSSSSQSTSIGSSSASSQSTSIGSSSTSPTTAASSESAGPGHDHPSAGIVAGPVVGGLAGIALVIVLLWCLCRPRRRPRPSGSSPYPQMQQHVRY
jgi:hypothetical protein